MNDILRNIRKLHCESCRSIADKYNKPFLSKSEYEDNVGKFSHLAGVYHAAIKGVIKLNK